MPTITSADIDHIATLARLAISEDEKARYAEQLSAVFGYMEMLKEVDVSDVVETCQVTGLEDVMRDDVAIACDEPTKKKLIAAFPEKVGKLLKVPAVFSDGE